MVKRIFRKIDAALLNGGLERTLRGRRRRAGLPSMPGDGHAALVRYDGADGHLLADLCDRHGTDKGTVRGARQRFPWPNHTYADYYASLFDHCRQGVRLVFECGIGTTDPGHPSNMGAAGRPGASLRVWRDYFPNARIVGADIDPAILFQEERIETHHLDQQDPAMVADLWTRTGLDGFDLMIDDGLHTFEAGVCLFENAVDRLSPEGVYVIEDVLAENLPRFRHYFKDRPFRVAQVSLQRPGLPLGDNSLVVVRRPWSGPRGRYNP